MNTRRCFLSGFTLGTSSLLAGCGTILYPDRTHQKERGDLDPAVVILDGIGLFFFLIPGVIAFAVDFSTGAIFFPADHEPGDRERTIFDKHDAEARLDRREIERVVSRKAGKTIDLVKQEVRVMELHHIDQFQMAQAQLSNRPLLAAR